MIWQYKKLEINCVKYPLSVAPASGLVWFARIHHYRINTTNQSQEKCLRSVNHAFAYTAGSPPPSHSAYWAVPLPLTGAVSALTWSDTFKLKLQTIDTQSVWKARATSAFFLLFVVSIWRRYPKFSHSSIVLVTTKIKVFFNCLMRFLSVIWC